MNTSTKPSLPRNATLLAGLLERLEAGQHADAAQYREVAARLAQELGSLPRDAAMDALLSASPVAATVYENVYYEQAGLCRSRLEVATEAEVAATDLIARARRPAASAS